MKTYQKSTELGKTEQDKEKMSFLHLKQIISQKPYRFSVLAPQKQGMLLHDSEFSFCKPSNRLPTQASVHLNTNLGIFICEVP